MSRNADLKVAAAGRELLAAKNAEIERLLAERDKLRALVMKMSAYYPHLIGDDIVLVDEQLEVKEGK